MGIAFSTVRQLFGAALVAVGLGGCASHANSHGAPLVAPAPGLVQIEVYDRTTGSTLPHYQKDGRRYIVGTPGHEYALRIRNTTGGRVLAVTSVDGVNVISGDTAAPSQSGYVLGAFASVEVLGWRKSLDRTAAFFFTEHQNSYAARTGRPNDVGVIGVAAFREKARPVDYSFRRAPAAEASEARAPSGERSAAGAPAPAVMPEPESAQSAARDDSRQPGPRSQAKLGTGHGRNETSHVRLVSFERASVNPAQTVTIQYDRRENLVAMGVLPAPSPRITSRDPNPFPAAVRFAPDPGR